MDFHRICPAHRRDLQERGDDLWCPEGHTVDQWIIQADDGTIIGRAGRNRRSMDVGPEAE